MLVSAFGLICAKTRLMVQFVNVDSELPFARISTGKISAG